MKIHIGDKTIECQDPLPVADLEAESPGFPSTVIGYIGVVASLSFNGEFYIIKFTTGDLLMVDIELPADIVGRRVKIERSTLTILPETSPDLQT